jgi:hypothetical protein
MFMATDPQQGRPEQSGLHVFASERCALLRCAVLCCLVEAVGAAAETLQVAGCLPHAKPEKKPAVLCYAALRNAHPHGVITSHEATLEAILQKQQGSRAAAAGTT